MLCRHLVTWCRHAAMVSRPSSMKPKTWTSRKAMPKAKWDARGCAEGLGCIPRVRLSHSRQGLKLFVQGLRLVGLQTRSTPSGPRQTEFEAPRTARPLDSRTRTRQARLRSSQPPDQAARINASLTPAQPTCHTRIFPPVPPNLPKG